jgi:hypothetical protein
MSEAIAGDVSVNRHRQAALAYPGFPSNCCSDRISIEASRDTLNPIAGLRLATDLASIIRFPRICRLRAGHALGWWGLRRGNCVD